MRKFVVFLLASVLLLSSCAGGGKKPKNQSGTYRPDISELNNPMPAKNGGKMIYPFYRPVEIGFSWTDDGEEYYESNIQFYYGFVSQDGKIAVEPKYLNVQKLDNYYYCLLPNKTCDLVNFSGKSVANIPGNDGWVGDCGNYLIVEAEAEFYISQGIFNLNTLKLEVSPVSAQNIRRINDKTAFVINYNKNGKLIKLSLYSTSDGLTNLPLPSLPAEERLADIQHISENMYFCISHLGDDYDNAVYRFFDIQGNQIDGHSDYDSIYFHENYLEVYIEDQGYSALDTNLNTLIPFGNHTIEPSYNSKDIGFFVMEEGKPVKVYDVQGKLLYEINAKTSSISALSKDIFILERLEPISDWENKVLVSYYNAKTKNEFTVPDDFDFDGFTPEGHLRFRQYDYDNMQIKFASYNINGKKTKDIYTLPLNSTYWSECYEDKYYFVEIGLYRGFIDAGGKWYFRESKFKTLID